MRWEIEMSIGGILIAVGIALFLTLPPPWWPNMGRYWLELGLCAGIGILIPGISLVIVAASRALGSEVPSRIVEKWDSVWDRVSPIRFIFSVAAIVVLLPLVHVLAASPEAPASSVAAPANGLTAQQGGQTGGTINNSGPVYNAPVQQPINSNPPQCPTGTVVCIDPRDGGHVGIVEFTDAHTCNPERFMGIGGNGTTDRVTVNRLVDECKKAQTKQK